MSAPDETRPQADPLAFMPTDAPEAKKRRWRRLAEGARAGRGRAAVELKCLDCCGWSRPEAARCAIRECPLWTINRRIFGAGGP